MHVVPNYCQIKKKIVYSFPGDGSGRRRGTCDISAWNALYLAVFWKFKMGYFLLTLETYHIITGNVHNSWVQKAYFIYSSDISYSLKINNTGRSKSLIDFLQIVAFKSKIIYFSLFCNSHSSPLSFTPCLVKIKFLLLAEFNSHGYLQNIINDL